ncbi:uncharacterized protein LOC125760108 [Rhipicephalus sanguineus]|uniref:Uncharacterized protein n=1 Tax=Rhipicephalus sanguineus TaxID=34632 RepID=A0A9D4QEI9_RHISA|nr:uncharacterized protein LOC125760108 [Rhipicephalus sanguineus]XP_049275745.1 uncharacterized protein LOC125760108 [Rhipicephalus sanguineus]KAH7976304.1 hypothetical protein HPB52_011423 [Rhipicephalus sanguineus]
MAAHRYTCVGFSPKADRKRIDFVTSIPSHRVCSVCSVIPDIAFSLGCRHVFCTACMNDLMHNSTVAVCPFDDKEFGNVNVSWDSASEGYVGSCKSYCLNRAFGCTYVGRMLEMIEHYYRECDYHVVYCGCCAKPVARVNVLAHLREGCGVGILTLDGALASATSSAFGKEADECLSAARKNIENFLSRNKKSVNVVYNGTVGSSDVTEQHGIMSDTACSSQTMEDTMQTGQRKANSEIMLFSTPTDDPLTPVICGTFGGVSVVVTTADSGGPLRLETKSDWTQTDPVLEWAYSEQAVFSEDSGDALSPLFNVAAGCASWAPDSAYHSSASESEATDVNRELEGSKGTSLSAVVEALPEPSKQPLLTYDWDVSPFRKYRNPPWPEFKSEVLTVGDRGYRLRLEGKFKFLNYPSRFLALYVRIQKGPHDASLEWPFRRKCSFLLMHTRYAERDMLFRLEDHVNVKKLPRAMRLRLERPKTAENFAIGIDRCVAAQQMVEGGFVYKNTFRVRFVVE